MSWFSKLFGDEVLPPVQLEKVIHEPDISEPVLAIAATMLNDPKRWKLRASKSLAQLASETYHKVMDFRRRPCLTDGIETMTFFAEDRVTGVMFKVDATIDLEVFFSLRQSITNVWQSPKYTEECLKHVYVAESWMTRDEMEYLGYILADMWCKSNTARCERNNKREAAEAAIEKAKREKELQETRDQFKRIYGVSE